MLIEHEKRREHVSKIEVVQTKKPEDYPRKGSKQAGGERERKCCALCVRVVPVASVRQEEEGATSFAGTSPCP